MMPSIILVTPISDEAKQWVDDNIALEGWQWLGQSFGCEPRYLYELVIGMENSGLVNGEDFQTQG
jgi:hypothetical protein